MEALDPSTSLERLLEAIVSSTGLATSSHRRDAVDACHTLGKNQAYVKKPFDLEIKPQELEYYATIGYPQKSTFIQRRRARTFADVRRNLLSEEYSLCEFDGGSNLETCAANSRACGEEGTLICSTENQVESDTAGHKTQPQADAQGTHAERDPRLRKRANNDANKCVDPRLRPREPCDLGVFHYSEKKEISLETQCHLRKQKIFTQKIEFRSHCLFLLHCHHTIKFQVSPHVLNRCPCPILFTCAMAPPQWSDHLSQKIRLKSEKVAEKPSSSVRKVVHSKEEGQSSGSQQPVQEKPVSGKSTTDNPRTTKKAYRRIQFLLDSSDDEGEDDVIRCRKSKKMAIVSSSDEESETDSNTVQAVEVSDEVTTNKAEPEKTQEELYDDDALMVEIVEKTPATIQDIYQAILPNIPFIQASSVLNAYTKRSDLRVIGNFVKRKTRHQQSVQALEQVDHVIIHYTPEVDDDHDFEVIEYTPPKPNYEVVDLVDMDEECSQPSTSKSHDTRIVQCQDPAQLDTTSASPGRDLTSSQTKQAKDKERKLKKVAEREAESQRKAEERRQQETPTNDAETKEKREQDEVACKKAEVERRAKVRRKQKAAERKAEAERLVEERRNQEAAERKAEAERLVIEARRQIEAAEKKAEAERKAVARRQQEAAERKAEAERLVIEERRKQEATDGKAEA
ncbi:Hypothetical predicted protein [Cloeon dipterum]|uniref:Uncharacterized protein n=1 Tax=Cloeon dipterum TaxID=197152 RepID=A0A8S1BKI7_9INSE|nr:Hypothetical predicted protein [Cloeon dipterum]